MTQGSDGTPPIDLDGAPPVDAAAPVLAGAATVLRRGTAAWQLLLVLGVLVPLVVLSQATRAETPAHVEPMLLVLSVAIMGGLSLVLMAVALRLAREPWSSAGAAREPLPETLGLGVLVMVAGYAAAMSVSLLYMVATDFDIDALVKERTEGFAAFTDIPLGVILPLALFVGFYEELLFRGFLLSRLRTVLWRTRAVTEEPPLAVDLGALLLSAVIFALAHAYQGWMGVFQTGALALVFGAVTLWRGNVWACVVAHALVDTLGLVLIKYLMPRLQDLT